jgi:2-polyprenyl-3-methyl-5-hydroxy-6-metoxy-1,4-benzoquinol methylase
MTITVNPENNETRALFSLAGLDRCEVLEVGCGDGRLTLRYAAKAAHVIAIDPFEESIIHARDTLPQHLQASIEPRTTSFLDFAEVTQPSLFDTVILSWSLC